MAKVLPIIAQWFFQLLLIFSIILSILTIGHKGGEWSIALFLFSYFSYIFLNLNSEMWCFFFNRYDSKSLNDSMKKLFYNPPIIKFHCECSHTEKRRGSKGRTHTVRVVTYRGTEDFVFYSWRDTSGIFTLKDDNSKRKKLVRLKLDHEFILNDPPTKNEFKRSFENFNNANRSRDRQYISWQTWTVDDFYEFNLVTISGSNPCFISPIWFLIFTFVIPLIEFYKLYVIFISSEQEFKIKKTISTAENLRESNENFNGNLPGIRIFDQQAVVFSEAPAPMLENPIAVNNTAQVEAIELRELHEISDNPNNKNIENPAINNENLNDIQKEDNSCKNTLENLKPSDEKNENIKSGDDEINVKGMM